MTAGKAPPPHASLLCIRTAPWKRVVLQPPSCGLGWIQAHIQMWATNASAVPRAWGWLGRGSEGGDSPPSPTQHPLWGHLLQDKLGECKVLAVPLT